MADKSVVEEITKKILGLLPKSLGLLKQDLESSVKKCVKGALDKFDLVSKETFDAQTQALNKAHEKLDELNKKVSGLEDKLKDHTDK